MVNTLRKDGNAKRGLALMQIAVQYNSTLQDGEEEVDQQYVQNRAKRMDWDNKLVAPKLAQPEEVPA
jgi:hypothetical protein